MRVSTDWYSTLCSTLPPTTSRLSRPTCSPRATSRAFWDCPWNASLARSSSTAATRSSSRSTARTSPPRWTSTTCSARSSRRWSRLSACPCTQTAWRALRRSDLTDRSGVKIMSLTVIEHVLSRLHDIGIRDVFGVPGDYAFPVNDAICNDPDIRWVGCSNELNAAYAADGYARIKGVAALCTTYGVGELSALNGIAGAFAEHLPVFHLVGMPNMAAQAGRAAMHHTLGNGEYNLFQHMADPVVCASAVLTPQNAVYETERLIAAALYHRRPVYMAFPADLAAVPVIGSAPRVPPAASDPDSLAAAVEAIAAALEKARTACVLPGILTKRAGLTEQLQTLMDRTQLPFATMFMDKSVLDEQQTGYMGMYDGAIMSPAVRDFVEACDQVLAIGTLMSDFNTEAFTSRLDPKRTITIGHHYTEVGGRTFSSV